MYWNCQDITTLSETTQLHIFANELSIDILLLNEMLLKSNHKLSLSGFKVYGNDRFTHGGAVAIAIKSSKNCKPEKPLHSFILPTFSANFWRDLDILTSSRNEFFLLGDFNAQHPNWNCSTSNRGRELYNHQNNSNYYINISPTPTRVPPYIVYRRASFTFFFWFINISF